MTRRPRTSTGWGRRWWRWPSAALPSAPSTASSEPGATRSATSRCRVASVLARAVGGLAFGRIYGQQRAWRDPIGYIALAVGVVATVALPILMARSAHPLIPLSLFKSRNFAVTNLSTLLIYGALYVTFYYLVLFQQGTLGYTAAAAGLGGIPGTLFLIFFSARFGSLAAKYGPRWFMAAGPVLLAR